MTTSAIRSDNCQRVPFRFHAAIKTTANTAARPTPPPPATNRARAAEATVAYEASRKYVLRDMMDRMRIIFTSCVMLISIPSSATTQKSRARRASVIREQIKEAESRLANMGYWTGPLDGVLDTATRSALIAFQKWEGRAVTG